MFKIKRLLLITLITPLSIFSLLAQKSFQKSIFFETKKSILREESEVVLFEIADTLNEFADYKIEIFSSAESGVTNTESKKISESRAKAVMTYFTQKGINRDKFSLAIESESSLSSKLSEAEKAFTRRVEIVVRYSEKSTPSVFDSLNTKKIESVSAINSNSYDINGKIEKTAIQKLFEEIADKPTVKTVITSKTKTIKVVGEKGTVLLIPSDALDVPEGSEVTFTLREAYKMSDMLAENLTTRAGDDMLASGGMVKITATLAGKEIQPVKPFVLMMPKDKNEPMRDSMRLFNGVTDSTGYVDWQLPFDGGFQLKRDTNYRNLAKKLYNYANLKYNYKFFTDTCSCNKMYVWKITKSRWKYQKRLFTEGKITEKSPRFIYSNEKPAQYNFYKINVRNQKLLSDCGDTLSSFCKAIAVSNSPKSFSWQVRHKYIKEWEVYKKRKKGVETRKLLTDVISYRNYKAKNYYDYLKIMGNHIDSLEREIVVLGLEKTTLDSLTKFNYDVALQLYKKREKQKNEKLMNDILNGKDSSGTNFGIAASYYLFEATDFNWVNCDYFYRNSTNDIINVVTESPNRKNVNANLLFIKENVILPRNYDDRFLKFSNVEKNKNAVLVSVKIENDKAYLAMKSVATSEAKVELKYEEITPQLLKEKLKTLDKYQIKLFPNPTHDVLNIQVNTNFTKIQVVNLNGQVVLEDNSGNKSEHQINVSQIPNNIYTVRIFEGEILRGVEKCVISH